MTRNQGIRRFRIMWRWHSENPKAEKTDWPGWRTNGGKYKPVWNDCFLCDFDCCLIDWPTGSCMASGSLYMQWESAKSPKKRRALAKQISELPVRRLRKEKK